MSYADGEGGWIPSLQPDSESGWKLLGSGRVPAHSAEAGGKRDFLSMQMKRGHQQKLKICGKSS